MQKKFHELRVQTFVRATEDEERIERALENFLEKTEPFRMERIETRGAHNNPMVILILTLRREKFIKRILKDWKEKGIWDEAMRRAGERLDDSLNFHFRVDKDSAYHDRLELWNEGESIDVRLKVISYPSSREAALKILGSV